jgi:hypothetical protein
MIPKKYDVIVALMLCALALPVISFAASAPWVGLSFTGKPCLGGKTMSYGPFDYNNVADRRTKLPIVEEYHFTKDIEMLVKGNTGSIPADIDYTLTAFPNHHKALVALMYYQLINQPDIATNKKPGLISPLECYLQRAIYFSPQDAVVYSTYAAYLKKIKHFQEAEAVYKKAIEAIPAEPAIKYSYGLFLCDLKKYPEALAQAQMVYQNGYPKQKLKQLLMKSGHWQK